jgi:catalase-peroxidase
LLIDRVQQFSLSTPEVTVLRGGLRVLSANLGDRAHGVLTERKGTLSNDFFVNLLDTSIRSDRGTGAKGVDLLSGSNSRLHAISPVAASADPSEPFVRDFVAAWTKVM